MMIQNSGELIGGSRNEAWYPVRKRTLLLHASHAPGTPQITTYVVAVALVHPRQLVSLVEYVHEFS